MYRPTFNLFKLLGPNFPLTPAKKSPHVLCVKQSRTTGARSSTISVYFNHHAGLFIQGVLPHPAGEALMSSTALSRVRVFVQALQADQLMERTVGLGSVWSHARQQARPTVHTYRRTTGVPLGDPLLPRHMGGEVIIGSQPNSNW